MLWRWLANCLKDTLPRAISNAARKQGGLCYYALWVMRVVLELSCPKSSQLACFKVVMLKEVPFVPDTFCLSVLTPLNLPDPFEFAGKLAASPFRFLSVPYCEGPGVWPGPLILVVSRLVQNPLASAQRV